MRQALLIATLLVSCRPSLAADIPHFDVETQCKRVASFGGSYSETTFDSCMEIEQSAYDQLKVVWSKLGTDMKGECTKIAGFGGPGSYSTMQSCVEMEMEAANKNKDRKFNY